MCVCMCSMLVRAFCRRRLCEREQVGCVVDVDYLERMGCVVKWWYVRVVQTLRLEWYRAPWLADMDV